MAEHDFEVLYEPPGGISENQATAVRQIQDSIAKRWSAYDGRKDDPRGDRSSPPVGLGWGFERLDHVETESQNTPQQMLQMIIGELTTYRKDGLSDGLRKRLEQLHKRAEKLRSTNPANVEYPSTVKSLRCLVDGLFEDIGSGSMEQDDKPVAQVASSYATPQR